ncbi:hypothetical protein HAX54_018504 [Datura stramonium]|uniref:Uncharacterized protein n=1 Tax=Datura stramonium TaxID=4076 RepID=A0ABS8S205_DATST|nr:hypothetical protein [Datura stramonium]
MDKVASAYLFNEAAQDYAKKMVKFSEMESLEDRLPEAEVLNVMPDQVEEERDVFHWEADSLILEKKSMNLEGKSHASRGS